jgi:hypothetical protein
MNIALTTNQVFFNPSTSTHTTHRSYIAKSEFNYLDDKFYYDPDTDWIFDSGATKHICQNYGVLSTSEPSMRQSSQAQGKIQ